jgi:hypothetical protein
MYQYRRHKRGEGMADVPKNKKEISRRDLAELVSYDVTQQIRN